MAKNKDLVVIGNKPASVGRPTKYDPLFSDQARSLCLLGATDDELANFFGVDVRTINRWKKEYAEFCQALKTGKLIADSQIAQSLYNKALSGDVTACIFWLKNRQREKWRDGKSLDIKATEETKHKTVFEMTSEELMEIARGGSDQGE